ncbi:YceI family protein [soil metagenome]
MYTSIIIIASNLLLAISTFAQSLIPVDAGSSVKFSIKNLGITVNGIFTGIKGEIIFDPLNPNNATFNLSVNAATVNTGINLRDSHLKKEDYFNVNKFPLITFLSTKVSASDKDDIFIINGNITIKGVTKSISFPFRIVSQQSGYLFKGAFKLNRRDFHVGSGSLVLSDNLDVSFSVYATTKT